MKKREKTLLKRLFIESVEMSPMNFQIVIVETYKSLEGKSLRFAIFWQFLKA